MKVLNRERDSIISDGTKLCVAIWHISGVQSWLLGLFTLSRSGRYRHIRTEDNSERRSETKQSLIWFISIVY
jgi:hypothetical protein